MKKRTYRWAGLLALLLLLLGMVPAAVSAQPVAAGFPAATVQYPNENRTWVQAAVPPTAPNAVYCWATIDAVTIYSSTDAAAVQTAVDTAAPGDLVKVAGTCPGVQVRNGLTQTVYIDLDLALQGGYTYTDWMAPPDPDLYPTVLDAQPGPGRGHHRDGDTGHRGRL